MFIYTDFDRRRIGFSENKLDRKVGDFTIVCGEKGITDKVMVYALVDFSEDAEFVIRRVFGELYKFCYRPMFHEHLNKVVEEIIAISSDEARCKQMRKMIEQANRRKEAAAEVALLRAAKRLGKELGICFPQV